MTLQEVDNGQVSPKRRYRLQFRLASLFWLTLVVAAFFLGRSSDQLYESLWHYWSTPAPVMLTGNTAITLRVGENTVIRSKTPLTRMTTRGPRVCHAMGINATDLLIVGEKVGQGRLDVWPRNSAKPRAIRVSVTQ